MADNGRYDPAEARLDSFAGDIVMNRGTDMGYPMNQKSQLKDFYKWFAGSGLNLTMVNNAGCHTEKEQVKPRFFACGGCIPGRILLYFAREIPHCGVFRGETPARCTLSE